MTDIMGGKVYKKRHLLIMYTCFKSVKYLGSQSIWRFSVYGLV